MKRNSAVVLSIALCVGATNFVFAQSSGMGGMDMKSMEPKDKSMNAPAAATRHSGVGVVKSVNATDGTVTLAHDPVQSLKWPAMTMGFKTSDKSIAGKVKPGDKVNFTFVQSGKDYVITKIK